MGKDEKVSGFAYLVGGYRDGIEYDLPSAVC